MKKTVEREKEKHADCKYRIVGFDGFYRRLLLTEPVRLRATLPTLG